MYILAVMTCNLAGLPQNGTTVPDTFPCGYIATCPQGFMIRGDPQFTCGEDGRMNRGLPSCIKQG